MCARDQNRNGTKEDTIILKLQLLHRRLLFYRYFNGLVVIKFGACVRFKFCSSFSPSLSIRLISMAALASVFHLIHSFLCGFLIRLSPMER